MLEDVFNASNAKTIQIKNKKCIRRVPRFKSLHPNVFLTLRQKIYRRRKAKRNQMLDAKMTLAKTRTPRPKPASGPHRRIVLLFRELVLLEPPTLHAVLTPLTSVVSLGVCQSQGRTLAPPASS
jgi:hypothetical protein